MSRSHTVCLWTCSDVKASNLSGLVCIYVWCVSECVSIDISGKMLLARPDVSSQMRLPHRTLGWRGFVVIVANFVNRHMGTELFLSYSWLPSLPRPFARQSHSRLSGWLSSDFSHCRMAPLFDILLQSDQVLDCLIKDCAVLFSFSFFFLVQNE